MDEKRQLQAVNEPLLDWYRRCARVLPWRSSPWPYWVWLSEIMLQQTRVAAAIPYFHRFLEELPDIPSLAACPEERLLKLWEGLGYYNRVRNMQKAARIVVERWGGELPGDYEAILSLPGVGEYTAGAISAIAFGIPVPAVDGNVLRVCTRVLGSREDIGEAAVKSRFRELLLQTMPQDCPGDFDQALMELGALVCLPNGAPLCEECPLKDLCRARIEGLTEEIPVKAPKKGRRVEEREVFLLLSPRGVALRKRPGKGLLAGLWEFPNRLVNETPEDWIPEDWKREKIGTAKHIFSHVEWRMEGLLVRAEGETLPEGWIWADRQKLAQLALPSAFEAYLRYLEGKLP